MLDTLKASFKFTEVQMEQLRSEVAKATNESGVATSNRFACLEEDWSMRPVSRPTTSGDPTVSATAPVPAAAFTGWFDKPAQTIKEAEQFVEAATKISEKRKELGIQRQGPAEDSRSGS